MVQGFSFEARQTLRILFNFFSSHWCLGSHVVLLVVLSNQLCIVPLSTVTSLMKRVWLEFMTMISVETYTFQGQSTPHRLAISCCVSDEFQSIHFSYSFEWHAASTKINSVMGCVAGFVSAHINHAATRWTAKWVFQGDGPLKSCAPAAGSENHVSTTLFITHAVIIGPEGSLV